MVIELYLSKPKIHNYEKFTIITIGILNDELWSF